MRAVAFLIFGVVLASSMSGCAKPSFTIHQKQQQVELDFRFLGEYPSSITRLRITEAASGRAIWDLAAEEGYLDVWTIQLRLGANSAAAPKSFNKAIRVIVPDGSDSFTLGADTEYRVEACEKRGHCAARRFSFPTG
jgi:hypothetical protein